MKNNSSSFFCSTSNPQSHPFSFLVSCPIVDLRISRDDRAFLHFPKKFLTLTRVVKSIEMVKLWFYAGRPLRFNWKKSFWCIYVNYGLPYTKTWIIMSKKKKRVKRYLMGRALSYVLLLCSKDLIYLKPSHNEVEFQVMAWLCLSDLCLKKTSLLHTEMDFIFQL